MKQHIVALCIVISGILALPSCNKDDDPDANTDIVTDHQRAEANFDMMLKEVDRSAFISGLHKASTEPEVTLDTTSTNKMMTLDYGATDMLCSDGKYRRGRIEVRWTGAYLGTGTIRYITLKSFFQGNQEMAGIVTMENMERDTSGFQQWKSTITDGRVIIGPSDSIGFNFTGTRVWISGEDSTDRKNNNWLNDRYRIIGTGTGVSRKGISYSYTIRIPVEVKIDCVYRVITGSTDLQPASGAIKVVDYGNGACDPTMTVNISGKNHSVSKY